MATWADFYQGLLNAVPIGTVGGSYLGGNYSPDSANYLGNRPAPAGAQQQLQNLLNAPTTAPALGAGVTRGSGMDLAPGDVARDLAPPPPSPNIKRAPKGARATVTPPNANGAPAAPAPAAPAPAAPAVGGAADNTGSPITSPDAAALAQAGGGAQFTGGAMGDAGNVYANVPRKGAGLDNMTDQQARFLGLTGHYESGWRDVNNWMYSPGFTASGYYQITDTNWKRLVAAHPEWTTITDPNHAKGNSLEDQTRVALALLNESGEGNWTKYNKQLASALGSHEQVTGPQVAGAGGQQPGTSADAQQTLANLTALANQQPPGPAQPGQPQPGGGTGQMSLQNLAALVGMPNLSDPYDIAHHPIMGRITQLMSNPLLQGALGGYLGYLTSPRWEKAGGRIAQGALGGLGAFNQAAQQQLAQPAARAKILESLASAQEKQAAAAQDSAHATLYSHQSDALAPNASFADAMETRAKGKDVPAPVAETLMMLAPQVRAGTFSAVNAMKEVNSAYTAYTQQSRADTAAQQAKTAAAVGAQRITTMQSQDALNKARENLVAFQANYEQQHGALPGKLITIHNEALGLTTRVPDVPNLDLKQATGQDGWEIGNMPSSHRFVIVTTADGHTYGKWITGDYDPQSEFGSGASIKNPDEMTLTIARAGDMIGAVKHWAQNQAGQPGGAAQQPAGGGGKPPAQLISEAASDPKLANVKDWELAPSSLGLPVGTWYSPSTHATWHTHAAG